MNGPPAHARDTRLDVFRALALITIYVNHVPGTVYEHFTHRNLGFSDAAEAFVLISGVAAGFAYGARFGPGERLLTTLKAWRRAGVLYVAHTMASFATLAIFCAGALFFARPDLLERINIAPVMERTPEALLGLVTLGHQLGYNNILSIYAVILLMLPGFLLLMRFGPGTVLGVSAALWLAAGLWRVAPPNFPNDGVWFLNPLSWQFLFVIGLVAGVHARRGGGFRFPPWLVAAAAAYLALALVWVRVPLWGVDVSMGLPAVLTGFDKTFLSAPRLLHVLAAACLVASVPAIANLARTGPGNPLAVLGRHALPVFVAGTLLAMAAQVLKEALPASLALDTLLVGGGLAAQFALAFWLHWLPSVGLGGRKAAASAKSPARAPTGAPTGAPEPGMAAAH